MTLQSYLFIVHNIPNVAQSVLYIADREPTQCLELLQPVAATELDVI